MALSYFEATTGLLGKYIAANLQKEGIHFKLAFEDLHTLKASHITYHNKPLAKQLLIKLRYLPLLRGWLYFDEIAIENLHIDTIKDIAPSQSKKSTTPSFPLRPFIKEAFISASFQRYFARAHLQNFSLFQADITKLQLQSPYGKALASGSMNDKKLQLQGIIYPDNLPLTIHKGYFSTTITPTMIDFTITSNKAAYKQIAMRNLKVKGKYDYKTLRLQGHLIATMQQTQAAIAAKLRYGKNLFYNIDANITNKPYPIPIKPEFYKTFLLQASGMDKKTDINLTNSYCRLAATIDNDRFTLFSSTIKASDLNETLPKDMTLNIQANGDLTSQKAFIHSNYFDAAIDKSKAITAKISFAKPYHDLNLPALSPLAIEYDFSKLHFASPLGKGELRKDLQGHATLAGAKISLKKKDDTLLLHLHTPSLKTTIAKLSRLYPLKAPKKDATLLADSTINLRQKRATATIKANAKRIDSPFSYFEAKIEAKPTKIVIPYYALVLKNRGFYSTKPSTIQKDGKKYLFNLWLEDSIKVAGEFDPKTQSAKGSVKATNYHYSSIEGELRGNIDLQFVAKKDLVDVQGDVTLLQGVVTYKPQKNRTIEDKDIIVVDEMQERGENFFQKYVSLYIKIDAKRPILYKIPELYALLRPDLLIYKERQKPLQLLGTIKILRGRYQVEESAFDVNPSTLSFYGPAINPLLELYLKTIKNNYTIYISVAGDLENPILHFDSEPPIQESEILSLLAFGASSKSLIGSAIGGSKLGSMLSNLFIKDLIATFGIKLDTLSLITSSNRLGLEIGKRLNDKITVIYKNDEISTLIIRYRFNSHIESDFIFGPNKSGAHLFYRQIK